MKRHPSTLIPSLLILGAASAGAATLNVPGQYATIGAALTAAQSADIIQLAPGTYTTNLTVGKSVTIQGAGSGATILNGNAADAVVSTLPGFSVTLRDLTLTNGHTPAGFGHGGAVFNEGTLRMERCVLSESVAAAGGGGLSNYNGDAILVDCTITNNSTSGSGGGVENNANLTMTNCSILTNTSNIGGGIANNGTLSLTNCTVVGNATGEGGALYNNAGTATLYYCTVYKNSASLQGGGIVGLAAMTTKASIIAGNTAPVGPDIDGTLTSLGYNFFGTTKDGSVTLASGAAGDQKSANTPIDPKLQSGPQNNGGATPTCLPLAGSPVIDHGAPADYPATDQRGTARPQDGDANGTFLPDAGAVEAKPAYTVSDAAAALRLSAGITAATSATIARYDVEPGPSGDGKVSIPDALRILRKVTGKDTPNP